MASYLYAIFKYILIDAEELENYKLKKISTIEQAKQEEENFRNGYSNKIKQVVELDDYDWLNE